MSNPQVRRPYYFSEMTRMRRRFFGIGMFFTATLMSLIYPDAIFRAVRKEIQKRDDDFQSEMDFHQWQAVAHGIKAALERVNANDTSPWTDADITSIVNSMKSPTPQGVSS